MRSVELRSRGGGERERERRERARGARAPCAVWLLCALLLPRAAQAQTLATPSTFAEPSAAQRETARAWVLEGRRSLAAREYAAALARFSAAYQLVPVPTVGIEMARAREALGQWVEANAIAVEVINLPRSPAEPAVFEQARDAARELLRSLTARIPALQLDITPIGVEAQVAIDGEQMLLARGGLPFRLNPGTHQLAVHAPGYRPELRTVTLVEQEVQVLAIALVEELPSSGAASGSGIMELARAQGDPGAGARTRGHVALGLAGGAALLGGVTGVLAFSSKPDCPGDICAPELRDEAQRSRSFGNVATVSFGVALAAAAYGAWELLVNAQPASGEPPELRAGLMPSGRGAALQLSGSF